jgi:hypothetical protein
MKEWDQNGSYGDWLGECSVDPVGSGEGSEVSFCKYGDEPSGSAEKELVKTILQRFSNFNCLSPS